MADQGRDQGVVVLQGVDIVPVEDLPGDLIQVFEGRVRAVTAVGLGVEQPQLVMDVQKEAGQLVVDRPSLLVAAAQLHAGARLGPAPLAHAKADVGGQHPAPDQVARFLLGQAARGEIGAIEVDQLAVGVADDRDADPFQGGHDLAQEPQRGQALVKGLRRMSRDTIGRMGDHCQKMSGLLIVFRL